MGGAAVDLTTRLGPVRLENPVMTASGTAGHGTELAAYGALAELGAVVVKSLTASPWPGNPPPRMCPVAGGMLNSVGLQGPGISRWLEEELPALLLHGARVVVSIWGRTVEEFGETARQLGAGLEGVDLRARVLAVEVNVSCPNLEDRSEMFAHSPSATAAAVSASACGFPLWAKLSPSVTDIAEVAAAALEAGAEGLTLVNTLPGMVIDVEHHRPALGTGGGGLSGPPLGPVAVRAVWNCRQAFPDAAIVGVGGVATGVDAVQLLMAGADAVQVGTAMLRDPRAPWRVLRQVERWCRRRGVARVSDLRGAAHAVAEAT